MAVSDYLIAFILGAAVAVATAAAVFLLFRFLQKRGDTPPPPADRTPVSNGENPVKSTRAAEYWIEMENMSRPDQTWQIPLDNEILIGRREDCTISLSDPHVSRRQCKIIGTDSGPALFNLSRVNETQVNQIPAADGQILREGNILTVGQEQIRVRRIRRVTDGEEPPRTEEEEPARRETPPENPPSGGDTGNVLPQEEESFW